MNNLTQTNIEVVLNLLQSNTYDISSCLANCSNRGVCKLDEATQKYICECEVNFTGKTCQFDERPCSKYGCLNNGTCINLNTTSFKCECKSEVFYGQYCENRVNLCQNRTCSHKGYCIVNETQTQCKCSNGFSGNYCETEASSVKLVKGVQFSTTIICIVCLVLCWSLFLCCDIMSFFRIPKFRKSTWSRFGENSEIRKHKIEKFTYKN